MFQLNIMIKLLPADLANKFMNLCKRICQRLTARFKQQQPSRKHVEQKHCRIGALSSHAVMKILAIIVRAQAMVKSPLMRKVCSIYHLLASPRQGLDMQLAEELLRSSSSLQHNLLIFSVLCFIVGLSRFTAAVYCKQHRNVWATVHSNVEKFDDVCSCRSES